MTYRRRTSCLECAVRESALCQVLDARQLADLNRHSFRKRFSHGQVIAGLAAAEDWCATILEGVVKLTKSLPDGRQQIVALLFPSDFLGRPFKTTGPHAAEAATDVELCCYERRYFEALLAEQPRLKQLFLERTLDAVDAAREWMLLLGRKNARERVAALLLTLYRRMQPQGDAERPCGHLELPLSRAEMADCLGLRLETVSRQLRLLQGAGVLERVGVRSLTVRDIGRLAQIALADSPQ